MKVETKLEKNLICAHTIALGDCCFTDNNRRPFMHIDDKISMGSNMLVFVDLISGHTIEITESTLVRPCKVVATIVE